MDYDLPLQQAVLLYRRGTARRRIQKTHARTAFLHWPQCARRYHQHRRNRHWYCRYGTFAGLYAGVFGRGHHSRHADFYVRFKSLDCLGCGSPNPAFVLCLHVYCKRLARQIPWAGKAARQNDGLCFGNDWRRNACQSLFHGRQQWWNLRRNEPKAPKSGCDCALLFGAFQSLYAVCQCNRICGCGDCGRIPLRKRHTFRWGTDVLPRLLFPIHKTLQRNFGRGCRIPKCLGKRQPCIPSFGRGRRKRRQ